MRHAIVAAALLVSLLVVEVIGQRMTIPEVVASGGGIVGSPGGSGIPPSVELMVRASDLVVVGTVANPRTALTADQMEFVTTYDVLDPIFIKPSNMTLSSRPGIVQSISFMQKGGSMTIGGKMVTYRDGGVPLMVGGMRGIFFLHRRGESVWLADMDYGALKIDGDVVTSLNPIRNFAPEFNGLTVAEAISRLSPMSR